MRRLSDITHIGRIIDPRIATNRFALLASLGTGLVLFGLDAGDSPRAVSGALATFAAWALARELDPDRPTPAAVAALTVAPSTLLLGAPSPGALFVTMVAVRILVRSTGLPPKWTDLAVVTVGFVAVADTPWGWAAGILGAFAIVRDAASPGTPPPNAALWGAAVAVGVTVRATLADGLGDWSAPDATAVAVVAAGLIGAAVVSQPIPVLSVGDFTRVPLDPRRVREGAILAGLTVVVAVIAGGQAGVVAMAPALLVFPPIAIARLTDR